jgi:rod shape determining protein RodA
MSQSFNEFVKRYDFTFFGGLLAIFIIGILNLYSATHNDEHTMGLYKTQMLWFVIANGVAFIVSLVSPKTFSRAAYFMYAMNVFLLILTLLMGKVGMGAQRWLAIGPIRIQPSEFMKMSLILTLARYYSKHSPEKELVLKDLIIPGIITLIPAVLTIVQPDLGTGLLLIFIFLLMTFYRRLKWKTIGIIVFMGIIASGIMYNFGLKEYQKKRILTFINPYADAKGSGYNAIQSEIAIGSGRLFGKGFKKSSQANLNYLPENHTDFVFAIFNEEHGFFGSLVLIALYVILLMRFIWLAGAVNKFFDSMLAIGILSIFFFHVFINMGMVMGLLPIVGIPLPLMSYGGSALLTIGILIGFATSLSNSKNLF